MTGSSTTTSPHDPVFREGFAIHVDDARLRYRRILVPGLAFLLAFGQSDHVDAAYRVTILGFLFLGVYWLSRYAAREGRNPEWGLFFCVIPAAATSVERLTIDIALAALCAGYAFYASSRQESKLTAILILAPFAPGNRSGARAGPRLPPGVQTTVEERRALRGHYFAFPGLGCIRFVPYSPESVSMDLVGSVSRADESHP